MGHPGVLPSRLGATNGSFGAGDLDRQAEMRRRDRGQLPFHGACDQRTDGGGAEGDDGVGIDERHVGIHRARVDVRAADAELRHQEVGVDVLRPRGGGGLAADPGKGPVVADVAGAVAGILVLRLVVGEAPGQGAPSVPDVAVDVEDRVRRRLGAVVSAGRAVGPVPDVEVVERLDRRHLDEERVDRDRHRVARKVGEDVGGEVGVALVRDAAREVGVVRRVVAGEDPVEVLAYRDQPRVVADRVRAAVGAVRVRDVRQGYVGRRAEGRVPALEPGVPLVPGAGIVQLLVEESHPAVHVDRERRRSWRWRSCGCRWRSRSRRGSSSGGRATSGWRRSSRPARRCRRSSCSSDPPRSRSSPRRRAGSRAWCRTYTSRRRSPRACPRACPSRPAR